MTSWWSFCHRWLSWSVTQRPCVTVTCETPGASTHQFSGVSVSTASGSIVRYRSCSVNPLVTATAMRLRNPPPFSFTLASTACWQPLSDGISPVQGVDRKGPTAVIQSAARLDHVRTGGTLLNQKFSPQLVEGDVGLDALMHLIRSYFTLGGHHIQFNVVTVATLRAAQAEPEKYRDLIVRVAGYSDYFCDLTPGLQEEIIARTEQQSF
ncbi:MAG: hypothetical protein C0398_02670 [Coprothermobacter sp.]|nr:hypothetical protein [Coprothermobacter sp.]